VQLHRSGTRYFYKLFAEILGCKFSTKRLAEKYAATALVSKEASRRLRDIFSLKAWRERGQSGSECRERREDVSFVFFDAVGHHLLDELGKLNKLNIHKGN
jgi:hypothetical protein